MSFQFRVMAGFAWAFALGWTLGIWLPKPGGGLPYGAYVVVIILTVLAVLEKRRYDK